MRLPLDCSKLAGMTVHDTMMGRRGGPGAYANGMPTGGAAGGLAVLAFGMAVNDRRKNQQTGEWDDYPNFVDCTLFGSRGEWLAEHLDKRSKVCVEGKLRYSQWERDGQKRSKIEVIVDEIEFMSRPDAPQGQQGGNPDNRTARQDNGAHGGSQAPQTSVYDEDIPF